MTILTMWRMAIRDQFHELNSKYLYLLENRSESPSINPGPVEMITRVVRPFARSGILLRAVGREYYLWVYKVSGACAHN